jgi:hypothetical protein
VEDGRLWFRSAARGERVVTDERADWHGAGILVHNDATRLDRAIDAELESWDGADWDRRTGAVVLDGQRLLAQTRVGVSPEATTEVEFFEFARAHGFSWLDKPRWGRP